MFYRNVNLSVRARWESHPLDFVKSKESLGIIESGTPKPKKQQHVSCFDDSHRLNPLILAVLDLGWAGLSQPVQTLSNVSFNILERTLFPKVPPSV